MFLQASVILSTGGVPGLFLGGCLVWSGGYPVWSREVYLVCSQAGGVPGQVLGGVPGLVRGCIWQTPPKTRYPPRPGTSPNQTRYPPGTRYTPLGPVSPPRNQVHPPRTRYPRPFTPPGTRYIPPDQVHPMGPGTPHRVQVHPPRIRPKSDRYVSYWNAFLFTGCIENKCTIQVLVGIYTFF